MSENIIEEFHGIKFLKTTASTQIPLTHDLFKVFSSIITKQNLEIDQVYLQQILSNDLNIDRSAISKQLFTLLTEALIYYIIRWPGWQRENEYQNGTLTLQDWFTRFQQYLVFKSKFIIKSEPKYTPLQVTHEDKGTQTHIPNGSYKQFAPYGLYIGAPPIILNNIVFEERNGDILLRRCRERAWKNPDLKALLHWPNVCISLNLPDISLSRSNVQYIERYMGLFNDDQIVLPTDHIIHIKKIPVANSNESPNLTPYTLEFFTYYVRQLICTLGAIPGVLGSRLLEVESILQQFLLDIDEANVYDKTMCTSISLRYHIGKFTYMRNRKMIVSDKNRISKNQNDVNYYERIIPQMDCTLHYFNAVQDLSQSDDISFISLNKLVQLLKLGIKSPRIENIKNFINTTCLKYSCMLCQKHMCGANARNDIIEHLRVAHGAEQPLICHKCSKEFDTCILSENRWLHSCNT